jgi:elongation factor Ts
MSMELIKQIREETALSLKDIKKAVDETGSSDKDIVIKHLREQGVLKAASRSDRATAQGSIFSYVHEGRIGCMVVIKCETDFVARSDAFKKFGEHLCLHIAAYTPKFLSADQVDPAYIESELAIAKAQLENEGKPADKINMILEGKKSKIQNESSLLAQPFIMDPNATVEQYMHSISQQTGEAIRIEKFIILNLN